MYPAPLDELRELPLRGRGRRPYLVLPGARGPAGRRACGAWAAPGPCT